MNAIFRDVAETQDSLNVGTITVDKDGNFNIPSYEKGKMSQLNPTTLIALGKYLMDFGIRMQEEAKASKKAAA